MVEETEVVKEVEMAVVEMVEVREAEKVVVMVEETEVVKEVEMVAVEMVVVEFGTLQRE